MIAATNYEQHRKAGTARGERAFAGDEVSRLSHAADDKAHDRPRRYSSARAGLILPVTTGRGENGSGHFLQTGWSGTLDEVADFRRLRAAGLKPEQAAALTQFNTGHHVACKLTDGPETHSSVPSDVRVLDDRDRDTKEFSNVRTSFQEVGIEFRG